VKTRLREELIDLVRRKDTLGTTRDIARWRPAPAGGDLPRAAGHGKTYFAKAIATAINAT
jgi:hypothetical protein